MTNTGASPAAGFAGERTEQFTLSEPRVSRLTPTLSAGARGVSGDVELEGWVTSPSVVAVNYNNTRSNRSTIAGPDSAVTNEELSGIHTYLEGEAVVAERFTVCLPDAEVPGGNGSIRAAVTPERLIEYVTGQSDGDGRVYAWGDDDDCDDTDESGGPGDVCGTTEHFAAAVSGPVATGGSLEVMRADDGTVLVINSPPEAGGGPPTVWVSADGGADGAADMDEWSRSAGGVPPEQTQQGRILGMFVSQVVVQPPGCPHPFPALLYVGRAVSDGQLIYSGGWVIDDAALYEDSVTMLTMVGVAPVLGIDIGDADADGLDDGIEEGLERGDGRRGRRVVAGRSRRGARLDAGTVGGLVEKGVLTGGAKEGNDSFRRKKPGRKLETDGEPRITHLALDAPVLHLVNAGSASNEVKFKAGAELSKSVN